MQAAIHQTFSLSHRKMRFRVYIPLVPFSFPPMSLLFFHQCKDETPHKFSPIFLRKICFPRYLPQTKIRNSNVETRNKLESPKLGKFQTPIRKKYVLNFEFSAWICFEFRVSCFEFCGIFEYRNSGTLSDDRDISNIPSFHRSIVPVSYLTPETRHRLPITVTDR